MCPKPDDSFDIYVYDEDGLIASKTGIVNPPMGYHTFRLDTPAAIQAGQQFFVEVRVLHGHRLYLMHARKCRSPAIAAKRQLIPTRAL